ncbi:hypothetical protein P7H29_03440 [Enterococcus pseudoavium]|uniref:hypothetical protein n=1 Tax=Enterococcus pseudoavium TaxID=44007 RepID=UPI00288EB59E|nr:hypothetical protein [Enterococcus pseudoavium]MDT2753914.1 hypothetical protein [Enterococcus pseudoavium]
MKKDLTKADREYYEKLRKLNRLYLASLLFIIVCLIILAIGIKNQQIPHERTRGFLTGFFVSMSTAIAVVLFRNKRIMNNPAKLKQERIKKTDERNIQIISKTFCVTSYVLIFTLAILSVIGSFISQVMMMMAAGLIYVFLISFLICYFYFGKKL